MDKGRTPSLGPPNALERRIGNSRDPNTGELNASFTVSAQLPRTSEGHSCAQGAGQFLRVEGLGPSLLLLVLARKTVAVPVAIHSDHLSLPEGARVMTACRPASLTQAYGSPFGTRMARTGHDRPLDPCCAVAKGFRVFAGTFTMQQG